MSSRSLLALALAGLVGTAACSSSPPPVGLVLRLDGEACGSDSTSCRSGHCDNGVCCASGSCCTTASDCPAAFRQASSCSSAGPSTDCQGTRRDATCEGFVCGTAAVADDSGCAGATRECGPYRPVGCTASADQPAAACPTSCAGSGECSAGYACVGNACVLIAGTGETCTGAGQGSCSAGLKCENGVCCDASGPACCSSAAHCGGGLACNSVVSACHTTCSDFDSSRCASPDAYCASNQCVPRLAIGVACQHLGECTTGVCECFNANCTDQRCRTSWCGVCLVAGSDTLCGSGLGSPAPLPDPRPGECEGPFSCYAGSCKRKDGEPCVSNADCGNTCIGSRCAPRSATGGPCDAADDCATGNVCAGGTCKIPWREPCTAASQCETGFCADGVCCSSACDQATCAACNVPGQVGTCAMPADDAACGSISCAGRNTPCRTYQPLTASRCELLGQCKAPNGGSCTSFSAAAPGTDCGVCYSCDAGGSCQPNSTDHGDCGPCQKCSGGSCVSQSGAEDLKNECDTTCKTGLCNGAGGCSVLAAGLTCSDGNSCSYGETCNGAGGCGGGTSYSCPRVGTRCDSSACDGGGGCEPACGRTYLVTCTIAAGEPGTRTCTCCGTCGPCQ